MTYEILRGDCIEQMRAIPDNTFDSVVCDPPYAFEGGFMGKSWDNFDGREDAGFGYWLAGFTDGEGHFRVQKHERGTHVCAFQLKLRDDDLKVLERIKHFVGAGSIHFIEGNGSSNRQASYVVQDKDGCDRIVTLFRKYPLTAKKAVDFEIWAEAVQEWLGRPRGNRWTGGSDQTRAAALKARLENVRRYTDVPWSGHKFQDWVRQWAQEALRVLKPGGHMLAFGSTRQFHRLVAGVEDAGFEIRDSIAWLYGSGFPKSKNLAGEWEGWGTALKPAHEPICVARKPLAKGATVAANVLQHGTGAINIDGCRVAFENGDTTSSAAWAGQGAGHGTFKGTGAPLTDGNIGGKITPPHDLGRWPANLIHDGSDEVLALFPDAKGQQGATAARRQGGVYGAVNAGEIGVPPRDDSGSAARFFYCAKASKSDRGPNNTHPTVKPLALMQYLCRLVTPPGGRILEPFLGSGSTIVAGLREGFHVTGIELLDEHADIAENRVINELYGDLI